jgi:hypothetical protein
MIANFDRAYYAGLDLGQAQDATAIAVIERTRAVLQQTAAGGSVPGGGECNGYGAADGHARAGAAGVEPARRRGITAGSRLESGAGQHDDLAPACSAVQRDFPRSGEVRDWHGPGSGRVPGL